MVTKQQLDKLKINDVSITPFDKPNSLQIQFILEEEQQAKELMEFLSANSFDLKVSKNKDKEYSFTIDFINAKCGIRFNSALTKEDYPPFGWLNVGIATFICTGIWLAGNNFMSFGNPIKVKDGINLN